MDADASSPAGPTLPSPDRDAPGDGASSPAVLPPALLAIDAGPALAPEADQASPQLAGELGEVVRREPHNLAVIALHMVVVRVGWIFKTESVIMPAYLDLIAGSGWLRGLMVVLNRFGQGFPPLLFGGWFESVPAKKWVLLASTLTMAVPFLALAAITLAMGGGSTAWLPFVFLLLYGVFSTCTGVNQMALCTLQGKLIRVNRRGRLLSIATFCGTVPAILFALWLLRDWLEIPGGLGYVYIFGFTGVCFLIAGLLCSLLIETPDHHAGRIATFREHAAGSLRVLRADSNLRCLCGVAMLFSTVLILFPHYQALARVRLGLAGENLMVWVVVQNMGTGLSSLAVGPLADRRGNRLTLRLILFATAIVPVVAIVISRLEYETGRQWYWLVFTLIGVTPMAMKTFNNYTLEICSHADHIHYLSTLNLSLVAPFCLAPLLGWLIDVTSFDLVFLLGAGAIAASGLLTFWLVEPRHGGRSSG